MEYKIYDKEQAQYTVTNLFIQHTFIALLSERCGFDVDTHKLNNFLVDYLTTNGRPKNKHLVDFALDLFRDNAEYRKAVQQ